jgi:hypothetical protein
VETQLASSALIDKHIQTKNNPWRIRQGLFYLEIRFLVLLPLLQRILRQKELPVHEVQQVPAPLQLMRHRQVLQQQLVLMLVLLPSGAWPHGLTQLLLFRK